MKTEIHKTNSDKDAIFSVILSTTDVDNGELKELVKTALKMFHFGDGSNSTYVCKEDPSFYTSNGIRSGLQVIARGEKVLIQIRYVSSDLVRINAQACFDDGEKITSHVIQVLDSFIGA